MADKINIKIKLDILLVLHVYLFNSILYQYRHIISLYVFNQTLYNALRYSQHCDNFSTDFCRRKVIPQLRCNVVVTLCFSNFSYELGILMTKYDMKRLAK